MDVILVRHTRPNVAEGLCYGRLDVGLLDTFADEAAALLRALPEVRRVVSSPLRRCRRLAEHIATTRALPMQVDQRLTEMDFGAWEGRPWSALPTAELDGWANDFMHARPHGGESVAMLKRRVDRALAHWSARQEPVALVTHSGVIKAAFSAGGTEARDFTVSVDFGGIMAFPSNQPQLQRETET